VIEVSPKRYKNDGNKCAIKSHNHHPRDCPGRARIKCAVCGKSLLTHKTMEYCTDGDEATLHHINELGRRQRS